jgi:hypothetical protein
MDPCAKLLQARVDFRFRVHRMGGFDLDPQAISPFEVEVEALLAMFPHPIDHRSPPISMLSPNASDYSADARMESILLTKG